MVVNLNDDVTSFVEPVFVQTPISLMKFLIVFAFATCSKVETNDILDSCKMKCDISHSMEQKELC